MMSAPSGKPNFRVFVSSSGNEYMTELAEVIAAALIDLGRTASVMTSLPVETPGSIDLVVAPHEFFGLHEYPEEARMEAARHCFMVTVEQPGTVWFETSVQYVKSSRLVVDVNRSSTQELRCRGIPTEFLQLGYHKSWDSWKGAAASQRPIDIVFLGALNRRREQFFAQNADVFSDFNCELRFFDPSWPIGSRSRLPFLGKDKYDLLSRSKILVNVHQGETGYFEWNRILQAIANGCLVISEPSSDSSPLEPFRHFIECPLERIPDFTISLLADAKSRQRITSEAYDFLVSNLQFKDRLANLLPLLDSHSMRIQPNQLKLSAQTTINSTHTSSSITEMKATSGDISATLPNASFNVKMLVEQRALRRQLEAIKAELLYGSAAELEIEKTPAFDNARPDVSIVVPLFNYANYMQDCLESVLASQDVLTEIIIVDDHSSDNSRDIVREAMALHEDAAILMASKRANAGLSEARNTGFRLARSDYVFLLDADNVVYPRAIAKLKAALETSGAEFAYCISERFGEDYGLISTYPWNPQMLLRANYIDATALIRYTAWEAAGGFNQYLDDTFGGWEDWDLWLRFAELGFTGTFVPQILTRYRVHSRSMLNSIYTNLDSVERYLRAKYRALAERTT